MMLVLITLNVLLPTVLVVFVLKQLLVLLLQVLVLMEKSVNWILLLLHSLVLTNLFWVKLVLKIMNVGDCWHVSEENVLCHTLVLLVMLVPLILVVEVVLLVLLENVHQL